MLLAPSFRLQFSGNVLDTKIQKTLPKIHNQMHLHLHLVCVLLFAFAYCTVPFYRTFRKIVPPWSGAWSCSVFPLNITSQAPSSKPKPRPKRPCGSRPPLQSHRKKRRDSSATALRISSAILIALTNSIGEAGRTDNADPNGSTQRYAVRYGTMNSTEFGATSQVNIVMN